MPMRVTKLLFFAVLLICTFSCAVKNQQFGTKSEFHDSKDSLVGIKWIKEIKNLDYSAFQEGVFSERNLKLNYRFLKPKTINQNEKYPLVVVFHGSGAIGTDNTSQMGVLSKMWLLPENRKNFPAFVISPQFPIRSSNYHVDDKRNVNVSQSNEYLDLLLKSVDSLANNPNIDRNRIYVMGFSMGGATTSNAISTKPDLFAAAINVSGISQFNKMDSLKNIPIWIVHGTKDTDNYPASNFRFFEELKNKNGKVFLWEYKDKYHNNILSKDLVTEIPKWLFQQNKNK